MKVLLVIYLIIFFPKASLVLSEIVPDCDIEFASLAIEIIRSQIGDPIKLSHIEAILSSCNKSRMQKMAEVSVFLLNKGTFPTRAMEDIQKIGQALQDERHNRLNDLRKQIPPKLAKTTNEVTSILLNNSLSGNEKALSLSSTIGALPRDRRRLFEKMLEHEATFSQMKPASTKIDDFRSSQGISVPTESNYTTESDQSTSLPFYIKKDGDVAGGTSEITPNSIVPGIPLSTIIRKSDEPSLERPLIRPITLERQQLFAFPPATFDRNALGGGLIDAMTKNRRESTNTAPRLESQDIPIKPVLSNKGRPHSVGNVHKYATNQLPTEGIDDADLLNSRSSILSDAMQFLQKTMPLFKPERFPIQYTGRYSHPYTFPLPEEGQHFASATNGAKSLSGHRTFLPLRNDPPNFRVMPISPINDVHRGLDGFDTHIGRFASGVPNRMLISTQSPIPIKDVDLNGTPVVGSLLSKTTQSVTGSEFSVYPDHRKGLFPEATNHARFESHFPQTFHLPQRQESTNQPATSGNNMIATNRGNVLLENYPPPPYGIAPRPKQTQGHDLLDTDRLGSWSMGRFNEEEPNYPTPEPFRDTTTIVAILQERTTRATAGTETPFFLEKTNTVLPEFRPYGSPQEITGSHSTREVYNIKQNGRPRFVKIDLLNE